MKLVKEGRKKRIEAGNERKEEKIKYDREGKEGRKI